LPGDLFTEFFTLPVPGVRAVIHSGAVSLIQLRRHVTRLLACEECPDMIRPVVSGKAVMSPVMLIGQAPGTREGPAGKPFAWTAGKTMFGWFADDVLGLGLPEDQFRDRVYLAAVCRCFPGKGKAGGDRVPDAGEVERCSKHLAREIEILKPQLIIPVGKLAIEQLVPDMEKLIEIVGVKQRVTFHGHAADMIALPHPSGASTWHRTEPGKTLLIRALSLIAQHPAWQQIKRGPVDTHEVTGPAIHKRKAVRSRSLSVI
jgi:uracil-DNA glycosylase